MSRGQMLLMQRLRSKPMKLLMLKSLSLLALQCVLASQLMAQDNDEQKREIHQTLRKMQHAAQKLNYTGTFVYQQGSQIRTSRIAHMLDGSTELEKLEILDGQPREYLRKNDEVSCYLPNSKTIQIEKNVSQEVFPAVFSANATILPESYQIRKGEVGRVAGAECQNFLFEPKDAHRYGYRLCVEKNSGLLLRAQTLNPKNEVIEQIAFTQFQTGELDRNKIKPSYQNVTQWRIENLTAQTNINSGWIVKALPPGFRKMSEMRRLLPAAPNAKAAEAKANQVIQLTYSDGLAAISVFIEPYTDTRSEGSLQQGALNVSGKRHGDYWLTVMGEVPAVAIRQVINSIELKTK